MISATLRPEGWTKVERPASLFRRFEFASYSEARGFLDRLARLSEATGLYPDLSFGKTYVNVTVCGSDTETLGDQAQEFAVSAAALASPDAD